MEPRPGLSRQERRERLIWPRLRGRFAELHALHTTNGVVLLTPQQAAAYCALPPDGLTTQRALAAASGVPLGTMTRVLHRLSTLRAIHLGVWRGRLGRTVARPQRSGERTELLIRRWLSVAPTLTAVRFIIAAATLEPLTTSPPGNVSHETTKARLCSLCGYTGLDVGPSVLLVEGRFVNVSRCREHGACAQRVESRVYPRLDDELKP